MSQVSWTVCLQCKYWNETYVTGENQVIFRSAPCCCLSCVWINCRAFLKYIYLFFLKNHGFHACKRKNMNVLYNEWYTDLKRFYTSVRIILKATVHFLLPYFKRRRDSIIVWHAPFTSSLDWPCIASKHALITWAHRIKATYRAETRSKRRFLNHVGCLFIINLLTTRGKSVHSVPTNALWGNFFCSYMSPQCHARVHEGCILPYSHCSMHKAMQHAAGLQGVSCGFNVPIFLCWGPRRWQNRRDKYDVIQ